MTIDDKIRVEKLQNDINKEHIKISTLPSTKTVKYEFLTGIEILLPDQSRVIDPAKFTFSHLGKFLEKFDQKQLKMRLKNKQKRLKVQPKNTDQKLKTISNLFSKNFSATEARNELKKT